MSAFSSVLHLLYLNSQLIYEQMVSLIAEVAAN